MGRRARPPPARRCRRGRATLGEAPCSVAASASRYPLRERRAEPRRSCRAHSGARLGSGAVARADSPLAWIGPLGPSVAAAACEPGDAGVPSAGFREFTLRRRGVADVAILVNRKAAVLGLRNASA